MAFLKFSISVVALLVLAWCFLQGEINSRHKQLCEQPEILGIRKA